MLVLYVVRVTAVRRRGDRSSSTRRQPTDEPLSRRRLSSVCRRQTRRTQPDGIQHGAGLRQRLVRRCLDQYESNQRYAEVQVTIPYSDINPCITGTRFVISEPRGWKINLTCQLRESRLIRIFSGKTTAYRCIHRHETLKIKFVVSETKLTVFLGNYCLI